MRIAQIAPLVESVPPKLYGGTERVVSYLCEELVARGHDVTLFASGDSVTRARLRSPVREALRLHPVADPLPYHMLMLDAVRRRAHEFDILHFHIEMLHFPVFADLASPTVTTLHGRLDLPDLPALFAGFPQMPLVSVSMSQRAPVVDANFIGNVYHGLPLGLHRPRLERKPDSYLAFIGRFSREKRPDLAIAIARATGRKIRLAAKVDPVDEAYFREVVAPLLGDGVDYVGEIDERGKTQFLGEADALLFPIDWPEPFGLVMIEAMACGTPVLAFDSGSVREVVENGVTGRIVSGVDEAVAALPGVVALDRARVRAAFERRFSVAAMTREYLALYERAMTAAPCAGAVRELGVGFAAKARGAMTPLS